MLTFDLKYSFNSYKLIFVNTLKGVFAKFKLSKNEENRIKNDKCITSRSALRIKNTINSSFL